MLVYHNVELNDYQLQNVKVHVTGTAPTAAKGQIYLDTGDNYLKYHNGTDWVSLHGLDTHEGYSETGTDLADTLNVVLGTQGAGLKTAQIVIDAFGEDIDITVDSILSLATGINGLNINEGGGFSLILRTSNLTGNRKQYVQDKAGTFAYLDDIPSLTNYLQIGDNISQLVNDSGYITSYTEVDTLDTVTSRGATTANNITVGDLTVSGDLVVSGSVTTINTETINLADNIITLNSNATGFATENAGLLIERGNDTNRGFRWNETSNTWQIQKDDNTYYDIEVVDPTGKIYAETISDTATVTHSFNTRDISVEMYDTVTFDIYYADWVATTVNAIDVTFYETPTNPIRVLITKQA